MVEWEEHPKGDSQLTHAPRPPPLELAGCAPRPPIRHPSPLPSSPSISWLREALLLGGGRCSPPPFPVLHILHAEGWCDGDACSDGGQGSCQLPGTVAGIKGVSPPRMHCTKTGSGPATRSILGRRGFGRVQRILSKSQRGKFFFFFKSFLT